MTRTTEAFFGAIHHEVVPREWGDYDSDADVEETYLDVGVAYLEWCEKRGFDARQAWEEVWQRRENANANSTL